MNRTAGETQERPIDGARGPRPRLLFVSPQFLFPMDAGGKIRTANILKHMKGGAFHIDLIAPVATEDERKWRGEITALADEFHAFAPSGDARSVAGRLARAAALFTPSPVSVGSGGVGPARAAVAAGLARGADLVVYDYVHSAAFAPRASAAASVIFAHNVETEIFRRHVGAAGFPMKLVYALEAVKMARFERRAAGSVDGVIAVSARDADFFRKETKAPFVASVPTGVDADFFAYAPPPDDAPPDIVFTGSMDWRANIDGLGWFMDRVWPLIADARPDARPDARLTVVGRNPPRALQDAAQARGINWRFTGFVEDVRDHARGAVYVIPLRVGGGTRLKAFEAMAMGLPVVSTALGVEGLELRAGEHYLEADEAPLFAEAVLHLLADPARRRALSAAARARVEARHSHAMAARAFEDACLRVLHAGAGV